MKQLETGFSLIELLVVIAVIGLIAVIAIPTYISYRARGYDATSHSDLRNLITAEEAYFGNAQTYAGTLPIAGFSPSAGVQVTLSANSDGFRITTTHPRGSKVYTYDSISHTGIIAGTSDITATEE